MDAQKALIANIFNNSTLIEVPFFQRSYVWDESLWQRLLDDMEFVCKVNKPHFLGSIILKEGRKPSAGDNFTQCRTVVDGQQRLTTFLIFLKVLCLKLGQTTLFDFQFRIMGKEIALQHGRNDFKSFEKVMSTTSADIIENPEPTSRVIEAYNFFVKNLDASKLNIMQVMTNTQFVKIDLDADEDEQEIFDTINSLGINLTTSELLKNYFFSRQTIKAYDDKWVAVFEKDDDARAYWEHEIETGRIKRAMIDIFFDAYFQLFIQDKKYSISNDDKLSYARLDNLAQSYQHFINNYCNGNKDVILSQLKVYATCFRSIFNPAQCDSCITGEYGIERLNIIVFGLKTSTLIPYLLYVTKNVADTDELVKIYRLLESYIMRRMIVHATTKNYNNLFTSLILNKVLDADSLVAKLKNFGDVGTYIPMDKDLKNGFETAKLINNQSKGIIYLIESKIRSTASSTALLGFNQYSLEHLMPKKWRNNWSACSSVEESIARDSTLLTLGNLAIIPQALNTSIRDAAWNVKKVGKDDGKPGLLLCAGGLCTIHDALKKDIWNEMEIEKRAQWLFEQAKMIWKIE